MKTLCLLLMVAAPSLARADAVLEWNEIALATIRRTSTSPPQAARALAMTHVAVYDAVNSIQPTRQSFRVYVPESANASGEAAAATAALHVLLSLYPAERGDLERAWSQSLARVPDGPAKSAGIRLGEIVAERIVAWRRDDGSHRTVSHPAGTQPGQWRPTPPDFRPALLPQWPSVAPFGISHPWQFRPAFPPDLRSAEYARHLHEVKALGAAQSAVRTAEQTAIAHYWADGAGTVTPPGHWNRIAQTLAREAGLSLRDNARLFALLNVALADAAIACWDMKFACNFWRPITAIHEADSDGNAQTQSDRSWRPLLDTPPFPSCTSGHSTFSGAASQALALFFGRDQIPFADTSEAGQGRRAFASFSQAAEEAGRSRIYGGIHFEFENGAGLESGRALARFVFDRHFQPLGASPAHGLARAGAPNAPAGGSDPPRSTTVVSYYQPYADETALTAVGAPPAIQANRMLQPLGPGASPLPSNAPTALESPLLLMPAQPAATYFFPPGW